MDDQSDGPRQDRCSILIQFSRGYCVIQAESLSFGPFQFEPRSGRLTKHGHRIKLQPKAATILARLLEDPGAVVSRTDLQKVLWPDGTHVDFEMGIKTAVKKLRGALNDEVDKPLYIQTVYGEGYRFIAPVTALSAVSDLEASRTSGPTPPEITTPTPSPQSSAASRGKAASGIILTATAALIAAVFIWKQTQTGLHFQSRDWVIIASFENRTGDAMLDGSIEYALARELSRSAYVNLAPQERIGDALRLMRQSPTAELTESLARQVALRDGGIKAIFAGRVERFGSKYLVTVRVLSPATGETLAVSDREAAQGQLPDAVRSLSQDLRRKLGEQMVGAIELAAPLERATTSSLSALRAFSTAMRSVNERQWVRAAELLEEALREDSQFALAHIYAAHCYSDLGQESDAKPHYEAAFRLAPGVNDRERLFILGSYFQRYVHDDQRARSVYEALVSLYPDDYWGLTNLMATYERLRVWDEWSRTAERVLTLRPNDIQRRFLAVQVWYYWREMSDKPKAERYREELLRLRSSGTLDQWWAGYVSALLDLQIGRDQWYVGDVKGSSAEVSRVSSLVRARAEDRYTLPVVHANLTLGKIRDARTLCGQVNDLRIRSECFLEVAAAAGDRRTGREQLEFLESGPGLLGRNPLFAEAFGETAIARRWSKSSGTPDLLHALFLIEERHPREALDVLRQTVTVGTGAAGPTMVSLRYKLALATALEEVGKVWEAIAELRDETRPAIVDLALGWNWPQCRWKLAELYREAGMPGEAALVEQEIHHYLSAADPDHPMLARRSGASK